MRKEVNFTNNPNHLEKIKKENNRLLTLSVEGVQSLTSVRIALERSRRSLCFSSHAT